MLCGYFIKVLKHYCFKKRNYSVEMIKISFVLELCYLVCLKRKNAAISSLVSQSSSMRSTLSRTCSVFLDLPSSTEERVVVNYDLQLKIYIVMSAHIFSFKLWNFWFFKIIHNPPLKNP